MIKKIFRYIYSIVAVSLIIFALVSSLYLAPKVFEIKDDYVYISEQIGFTSKIVDGEPVKILERLLRSDHVSKIDGDVAVIENTYRGFDRYGGITFDSSNTYAVDIRTRENVPYQDVEKREGHFSFPVGVEKKNYLFHSPEVVERAEEVRFIGEQDIQGITVYQFEYNIPKLDKSQYFPEETLEMGNVLGNHGGTIWVEPMTGHIVNFDHYGENDIHDRDTGELKNNLESWNNAITEDYVSRHISHVVSMLDKYNFLRTTLPIILAVLAVMLFTINIYVSRRNKKSE